MTGIPIPARNWKRTHRFRWHAACVAGPRRPQLLGVPLIIVRGDDLQVRAFVNSCSHRDINKFDRNAVEAQAKNWKE